MKYIIKYEKLVPGDIILDREDTEQSHKVRRITNSDYSHARVYVGGTIMEANGIGVQSVNPQRIIYDTPDDVVILRCKNIRLEQISNLCFYARSEFAKEFKLGRNENTTYCFRLVAESYQYAGIKIVTDSKKCCAKDFLLSDKLEKVPNMVRIASDNDLNIAYSDGILFDKGGYNQQTEAVASMFENIRNFVKGQGVNADVIQNDDKLVNFLIDNPQFDKGIAAILKESPYFKLWQNYMNQNPWEFDISSLKQKYGEQIKDAAMQMLYSCDATEPIWRINYRGFSCYYEKYHLESLKIYLDLYTNLLSINEKRRKIAESILE